jgi:hypothetical protein
MVGAILLLSSRPSAARAGTHTESTCVSLPPYGPRITPLSRLSGVTVV